MTKIEGIFQSLRTEYVCSSFFPQFFVIFFLRKQYSFAWVAPSFKLHFCIETKMAENVSTTYSRVAHRFSFSISLRFDWDRHRHSNSNTVRVFWHSAIFISLFLYFSFLRQSHDIEWVPINLAMRRKNKQATKKKKKQIHFDKRKANFCHLHTKLLNHKSKKLQMLNRCVHCFRMQNWHSSLFAHISFFARYYFPLFYLSMPIVSFSCTRIKYHSALTSESKNEKTKQEINQQKHYLK